MDFDNNNIICVKSELKYIIQRFWDLRIYLISKIDDFERQGYKFSPICEMKVTFISDIRKMTFEHYLNQPKSMIEWKLNGKLSRNPELIKPPNNRSYPLITKKICFPQKKIKISYKPFQKSFLNK